MLDDLCFEFTGRFDRGQIEEVMDDSAERIIGTARVFEFVPLMAYRLTRERLNALTRAGGQDTDGLGRRVRQPQRRRARPDRRRTHGRPLRSTVAVHSAGTAAHGEIDPGVRAVIAELGVDPDDAFARPVTDEVLRAADVIVTMGHSVGVIDLPQETRHEDWRVGDPIGAPVAEIRRVRDDIEYRVRTLLKRARRTNRQHQSANGAPHDREIPNQLNATRADARYRTPA